VFLDVRVANVQVTASSAHALNSSLLFIEIDVSLITQYSLGFVQRLGKATSDCEGVRSSGSAHVGVLTLESFGVDSYGTGLSIVTSGDASTELVVSELGIAAVHTSLNN